MVANEQSDLLVSLLRGTIAGLVRRDAADLSARQLAIFMICYLEQPAQTVRGLAATLRLSRPAVTRALDRLSQFDLIRRKPDPTDRRSILVQRTTTGASFMRELRGLLNAAAVPASAKPAPASRRQRAGLLAAD